MEDGADYTPPDRGQCQEGHEDDDYSVKASLEQSEFMDRMALIAAAMENRFKRIASENVGDGLPKDGGGSKMYSEDRVDRVLRGGKDRVLRGGKDRVLRGGKESPRKPSFEALTMHHEEPETLEDAASPTSELRQPPSTFKPRGPVGRRPPSRPTRQSHGIATRADAEREAPAPAKPSPPAALQATHRSFMSDLAAVTASKRAMWGAEGDDSDPDATLLA